MKGIDCATPLTAASAKALATAGTEFVCRYLVPEKYAWKRLTRVEAEAITAASLKIGSVWETAADRAAGGAITGQEDGILALIEARAIGQPEGTAIYFAVDYDAQPRDYQAIEDYLRAADAVLEGYRVGVYGSFAVVEEMARRGVAKHFWQTYAWSKGQRSSHANIYQYSNDRILAGVAVDLNESHGNEGFWDSNFKGDGVILEQWEVDVMKAGEDVGLIQAGIHKPDDIPRKSFVMAVVMKVYNENQKLHAENRRLRQIIDKAGGILAPEMYK